MNRNGRLINAILYTENDEYYLSALYKSEDDKGTWVEAYPKIHIPIDVNHLPNINWEATSDNETIMSIDMGFGEMVLKKDSNQEYMRRKLIKEKVHEMTLEEIEKKLGYKVKIIDNSDK